MRHIEEHKIGDIILNRMANGSDGLASAIAEIKAWHPDGMPIVAAAVVVGLNRIHREFMDNNVWQTTGNIVRALLAVESYPEIKQAIPLSLVIKKVKSLISPYSTDMVTDGLIRIITNFAKHPEFLAAISSDIQQCLARMLNYELIGKFKKVFEGLADIPQLAEVVPAAVSDGLSYLIASRHERNQWNAEPLKEALVVIEPYPHLKQAAPAGVSDGVVKLLTKRNYRGFASVAEVIKDHPDLMAVTPDAVRTGLEEQIADGRRGTPLGLSIAAIKQHEALTGAIVDGVRAGFRRQLAGTSLGSLNHDLGSVFGFHAELIEVVLPAITEGLRDGEGRNLYQAINILAERPEVMRAIPPEIVTPALSYLLSRPELFHFSPPSAIPEFVQVLSVIEDHPELYSAVDQARLAQELTESCDKDGRRKAEIISLAERPDALVPYPEIHGAVNSIAHTFRRAWATRDRGLPADRRAKSPQRPVSLLGHQAAKTNRHAGTSPTSLLGHSLA